MSLEEQRGRRSMSEDASRREKVAAKVGGNQEGGKSERKQFVGR